MYYHNDRSNTILNVVYIILFHHWWTRLFHSLPGASVLLFTRWINCISIKFRSSSKQNTCLWLNYAMNWGILNSLQSCEKHLLTLCEEHVCLNTYFCNVLKATVFRKNKIKRFCLNLKPIWLSFNHIWRKGDIVVLK